MRGTVIRRGRKWSAVLDVGVDDRGRRKRQWLSGFERRKDAERVLAEAIHRLQRGDLVAPSKLTFGGYLHERWLPSIAASVRSSTLARYRFDVATLSRELGHVPLQRLTGQQLDALYGRLLEERSPRTVRHLHAVAHRSLRDALRNQLVPRNVAEAATPPRAPRPELRTWTADELRAFLESVREDRLYAAWRLLAYSGCRRGELLGSRWSDLDGGRWAVKRSLVSVRNRLSFSEPKTARGRRSVALDRTTVAELRAHRRRQSEERLALGLGRQERDGLVFTAPLGGPIKPDSFSQFFDRRIAQLGLPRVRLHDLRHTHATLALAAGMNVKTLSERLGHASVAFTLDVYASAIPALEEQAAGRLAALLDG